MHKDNATIKAIAISGSLRKESYNRKALKIAKSIAVELGIDVEELDLKELNLPLYDSDLEKSGFPHSVELIRNKVAAVDMLIIATPEYNHSISGVLKNAIDWLSTVKNVIDGKSAVIFGASTGKYGTMRAQSHLRQILTALNVTILPQPQLFIGNADEVFDENDSLKDQKSVAIMRKLINNSLQLTSLVKKSKTEINKL
ncbi:MAG: NAD(P)H-dependent oxidoreductase [Ignavibacteriales bacterium]|nr:NAD(P)H-dependent oxidoreductase [Ignavibacteriales bacterium]